MRMKRIETDDAMILEWALDNVTPRMIDWFWSNMEKCNLLWHPEQHEPLEWAVPPVHGNPIGSIHIAPQTWSDGTRQNLYIQLLDIATLLMAPLFMHPVSGIFRQQVLPMVICIIKAK